MSDNDELILGLCPLPDVQDNVTDSNGANTSSPPGEFEGEVITGDVDDAQPSQDQQESEGHHIEYKPVLNQAGAAINVIYKPVPNQPGAHIIEYTHVPGQNDAQDANSAIVMADNAAEPVKVSTNLVDFINQAGAELMAGTNLEDDESDSQPAKKRRKVLPKGTYQCAECRTLCEDFNMYSSHMNTHSDIPLFTCMKCLYIFQDQALYEAHVAQTCRAAGNAKDKECAVCRKTFKYDSHLREHIICMHNKTPLFTCPICGQNITCWRRSIDRHMANHANNVKCPSCGLKGENIEAIDAHISENGDSHLRCKTCEYTSNDRNDFFSHVNVHIPKVDVLEPMVCYKCNHRFQRTSEFNNHVRLFCKFREVQASDVEAAKISAAPPQPTIQLPVPEGIGALPDGNAGILQLANDASKQMFTLPEGVNNNTFIPITVTTGNDEMGQTVILIPQILLMPNSGGLSHDGTGGVIEGGQNDHVIYLECLKPEQQGMLPMFEVPADKSAQEGIYANHLAQSVVQSIQAIHGANSVPSVQPVQTLQSVQAIESVQAIQPVQQVQSVIPIQAIQSLQAAQTNEPTVVENIKQEIKEEVVVEEEEEGGEEEEEEETSTREEIAAPVPSNQTSAAPSVAVQNVYSLASTTTTNSSSVDSVIQHVIDQSGPPALVCSVCNEVLKDSETYESHVKQHDKTKAKPPKPHIVVQKKGSTAFNCDQCGQGFAAKHHLEQHTITFHSDVAGIVCPVCRVGMASEKMSLNEHLAKVHKLRVEPSGKLTECSES